MKWNTQLDSVVFHLTPTRTRCDLIIIANGKKEKIASGLLNPFLEHLKTAQDQIAKGGYSIVLKPDSQSVASWFTKGTVERFVRFVSTPEILERVYIIDSEITQIEEAIAIQLKNDIQQGPVKDHQTKPLGNFDGKKSKAVPNDDRAVIIYKPEEHQPETSVCPQEGNSRVQILKVLETRKSVLQKEQGMAFARAVAAGFNFDEMQFLLSFGKCFGASRLSDACLSFMELSKKKHEARQWLEIGAAEAEMTIQSAFSSMNPSGVSFSNVSYSNSEKASDITAGERPPTDQEVPKCQQENLQGQFLPWLIHSPAPVLPLLQQLPVQGVPYCQTYSQNGLLYHPPMEDPSVSVMQRTGPKRKSMDKNDGSSERLPGDSEWSGKDPQHQEQKKKAGRSRHGQSRKIVIQNINYISKTKNSTSENSESASDTQSDIGTEGLLGSDLHMQSEAPQLSNARDDYPNLWDESNYNKGTVVKEAEIDGGHWLAFQNLLFRETSEDNYTDKDHGLAMVKGFKRHQNPVCDDYTTLDGRNADELQDSRKNDVDTVSIHGACVPRGSSDEVLLSTRGYTDTFGHNDQMDFQYAEIKGKKVYSRTANGDFMLSSHGNHSELRSYIDPLDENGIENVTNKWEKASSQYIVDESFIVPVRSFPLDDALPENTTTIDLDSELPTTTEQTENHSYGVRRKINSKPCDLDLMPKRDTEKSSSGYDPAWDYEMQVHVKGRAPQEKRKKETSNNIMDVPMKLEIDQRTKVAADLDKKKTIGPIRRGKSSKTSSLVDARARAEGIKAFKADIMKMKKEKEEADLKRLEMIKLERQKRIAERGSSIFAHSVAPQSQRRLPRKLSPTPVRGSKFSDSEPGSSSPLQRSKIRTPLVSAISPKTSKSSDGQLENNQLTKSAPSLFGPNKESRICVTPDSKASIARLRRLSEPKSINSSPASVNTHSVESLSKAKICSPESVTKPKKYGGLENEKASAIMEIDKRKVATLSELKIITPRKLFDIHPDKSSAKETIKVNDSRPAIKSENESSVTNDRKALHEGGGDENIVDKTVVMLENECSSIPVSHTSVDISGVYHQKSDNSGMEEKTAVTCEHASTDAPPSPFVGFVSDPIPSRHQRQLNSLEVGTSYAETPKFASIDSAGEPDQVPCAHISFLDDPCTGNSKKSKAPPAGSELSPAKPVNSHVNDAKTVREYNSRDASEKNQGKEPRRGLRRLWKFGKKKEPHNKYFESDIRSVDGLNQDAASTTSSSEVYTLKNLMSQDDIPTARNCGQKSRHFSLLSSLWNRTSERKSERKLTS